MESETQQWKRAAAESAVAMVKDGMVVGLGTGSTADLALAALGERVRNGLRISGIPTSEQTKSMARELGIPLSGFAEHQRTDIAIDGADEVDLPSMNLIKGRGGALLREKIVAAASQRLIIIVDETKLVTRLGERTDVPVEVVPFGWQVTAGRLRELGAIPRLRNAATGQPFVSDGGHFILDCDFISRRPDPSLAEDLDRVVGVIEHGLFFGMTAEVHVGGSSGVRVIGKETA